MPYQEAYYKLLCEREALKMEFLARKSPIGRFVKNSLQLWYASQWKKDDPACTFYGYGMPQFAIFRQIERKRALEGARHADETGNDLLFTEPFESMVHSLIKIGEDLKDIYDYETVYEAMREFHTPGFTNPFSEKNINGLASEVRKRQRETNINLPHISRDTHDKIIQAMIKLAQLDLDERVEIIETEAPACLGYAMGGVVKGVKLGLTYEAHDPLKSLYNNWHEIGHACYRQYIPHGYMVAGRAMDEAIAFLFEYHIGYSDDFLQFLLENGLADCGYDLKLLQSALKVVNRNTKRIDTNPLRHPIDVYIHSRFEETLINEVEEGVPPEVIFAKVIEPYKDIFSDDYSFYQDAHTRGGIFGDREAYNAGYAAAFQLGDILDITMENMIEKVRIISRSRSEHFAPAIERLTGRSLTIRHYMEWIEKVYGVVQSNSDDVKNTYDFNKDTPLHVFR